MQHTTYCPICYKVLSSVSTLQGHLRLHTGEKPFQCDICQKSFTLKSVLIRHKETHSEVLSCEICQESFQNIHAFKKHLKIHQSNNKPSGKCQVCNISFANLCSLKRHMKIHSCDSKAIIVLCDICSKTPCSIHSPHLRLHTGKKRFQCEICKKHFHAKSSLKSHIKKNACRIPYGCDICLNFVNTLTNLGIHKSASINAKSFHCEECLKFVSTKAELMRHLVTHPVKYECDFLMKYASLMHTSQKMEHHTTSEAATDVQSRINKESYKSDSLEYQKNGENSQKENTNSEDSTTDSILKTLLRST